MDGNILITGTGGFIGGRLKEYLKSRYNLLTPAHFELNLCCGDDVKDYFNRNKIDFIIHAAVTGGARGIPDKETVLEDNLSMVNNLLNAKMPETRMIVFGSGAAYDKMRNLHKVKETELGRSIPQDLYGASKLQIAQLAGMRADMLCLNVFACYGAGEKESRFPSFAVRQNIMHEPAAINQNAVFDYLYSEDMCRITEFFIHHKPAEKVINITPSKSISLLEIAEIINEISDYKSSIVIKNPEMNFEYTGDNSLLLKNIPDFQFTPIRHGLEALYNHIKQNLKTEIKQE